MMENIFFQSTDVENVLKIKSGNILSKKRNEDFFTISVPISNESFQVEINEPVDELTGIPFFSTMTTPR